MLKDRKKIYLSSSETRQQTMKDTNLFTMLALEDLESNTEEQVISSLISEYKNEGENGESEAKELLENKKVLIAYESVGSWGCDSSSYFLLADKNTNALFEIFGSHCSCYGFEGQLDLEPTNLPALIQRVEKADLFHTGGYDENSDSNKEKAKAYILNLQ